MNREAISAAAAKSIDEELAAIHHVMFTNVNGGDENLIAATRLAPDVLANAMRASGKFTFDETYEIPGRDLQYYLADRCTLTEAEERRAEELAASYQQSGLFRFTFFNPYHRNRFQHDNGITHSGTTSPDRPIHNGMRNSPPPIS